MPRASRSYCKSTPISKMGFTQRSSCKAQGFIKRSGKTNKGKYQVSKKYRKSSRKLSRRSKRRSIKRKSNKRGSKVRK